MFLRFSNRKIWILQRILPFTLLLFSSWAYAIDVDVTPVTMISDEVGKFTISWTGAGYTSELLVSSDGGDTWATTFTGYDTESVTYAQGQGVWKFKIRYCNFVMPSNNLECQETGVYTFSVLTVPSPPEIYLIETSDTSTFHVTAEWAPITERFEWQERKDYGPWEDLPFEDGGEELTGRGSAVWGYRVRACNQAGCSSFSQEEKIYVAIAPGRPGSISVPGSTYGTFTAGWGAASGSVTSYDLEIRYGDGEYSDVYKGGSRSKEVSVSETGTYYLRVKACRKTGSYENCSGWRTSSAVVGRVPPVPEPLEVPRANSSGEYTVSWSSVNGANTYKLQERKGSRRWDTVQNTPEVSKTFSGKGNSRYSYQAQACGDLGCSEYSSTRVINVVRERTGEATEVHYRYDALGRLQFVEDPVNSNRDYDYDAAGNRKAVAEGVLTEDEDPYKAEPVPDEYPAPYNLSLAGPYTPTGGYEASWFSVGADYYVVGLEDGSEEQTTETWHGTAELRPVWVYAVKGDATSPKSYF